MELILISDSKVKVMLNANDMQKFKLDCSDMDYKNRRTKQAFHEIFEEVRQRTGFEIGEKRLLVQVYPSRDGGCEMFVTKLNTAPVEATETTTVPRAVTLLSTQTDAYCFLRFNDLLSVCAELHRRGYNLQSSAYDGGDGVWYLLLQERVRCEEIDDYSFIGEYALCRHGAVTLAHIKEHCRCVLPRDAVTQLASVC